MHFCCVFLKKHLLEKVTASLVSALQLLSVLCIKLFADKLIFSFADCCSNFCSQREQKFCLSI